jgi:hypothetical protein
MAKTLLLVCLSVVCSKAATAKLGRRGVQLARPRIYLAVNDKARKRLARQKWVPVPQKQQQ